MTGYIPSIIMLILAFIFISIPFLAVIIISGALILGALIYGGLYYKLSKIKAQSFESMKGFEREVYEKGGPSFKNLTVTLVKTGRNTFGSIDDQE